jgi:hypothetical protein
MSHDPIQAHTLQGIGTETQQDQHIVRLQSALPSREYLLLIGG